jgi:HSP20 family molecular chaperone IbpA
MLVPRVFVEDLLDDPFENEFHMEKANGDHHEDSWMKTDVKETENGYEMAVNLPGFKKENVKISLNNGYLNIVATTNNEVKDNDKKGHMIRHERYTGSCQRSFYVGNDVEEKNIKAKFENGVLLIDLPKVDQKKIDESKFIAIE